MSPTYSIEYQLTRDETIALLWRTLLRLRTLVILSFIFTGGVVLLALGLTGGIWRWGFVIFPVVFLCILRQCVHRIIAQHPEFLEPQKVSFDETSITFTNSVTRFQWPWARLRSVSDTQDFLLLRFDTFGSSGIVPKRALTVTQLNTLLAYASQKGAEQGAAANP